jgi:hypothetical protein
MTNFIMGAETEANFTVLLLEGGTVDIIAAPTASPPAAPYGQLFTEAPGNFALSLFEGGTVQALCEPGTPTYAYYSTWPGNFDFMLEEGGTIEVFVSEPAPPAPPVTLATAADFAALSEAGISTTGATAITGDIGVSPAAATSITGFGLVLDGSGEFSTSSLVTGDVYAADYAAPTPAKMTVAVSDMQAAYTQAQGLTPTHTNLFGGVLDGQTLTPGIYNWTTDVSAAAPFTLDGAGFYVFQVQGTLTLAGNMILSGGAAAGDVFWAVTDTIAIEAVGVSGEFLGATNISTTDGSSVAGRLLAQTAVTLIGTNIVET